MPVGPARREFPLQLGDLIAVLHEGEADKIGMSRDEVEVAAILLRQRIEIEVDGRKIESAPVLDLQALVSAFCHVHCEAAVFLADNRAAQLAVINRDNVADFQTIQDAGRRAGRLERKIRAPRVDAAAEK